VRSVEHCCTVLEFNSSEGLFRGSGGICPRNPLPEQTHSKEKSANVKSGSRYGSDSSRPLISQSRNRKLFAQVEWHIFSVKTRGPCPFEICPLPAPSRRSTCFPASGTLDIRCDREYVRKSGILHGSGCTPEPVNSHCAPSVKFRGISAERLPMRTL